ncbi:hypothetical protein KCU91_g30, partial [Aureobasidium melanogenum]
MQLLPLLLSFPFLSLLLLLSRFLLFPRLLCNSSPFFAFFWASKALLASRASVAFCLSRAICPALALRCSSLVLQSSSFSISVVAMASAVDFAASTICSFCFCHSSLAFVLLLASALLLRASTCFLAASTLFLSLHLVLLALLLFLFSLFLFFLFLDQELRILSDPHGDSFCEKDFQDLALQPYGKRKRRIQLQNRTWVDARRPSFDESQRAFEVSSQVGGDDGGKHLEALVTTNLVIHANTNIQCLDVQCLDDIALATQRRAECLLHFQKKIARDIAIQTCISPHHAKGVVRSCSESEDGLQSVVRESQIAVGRRGIDQDMCGHKIGFLVSFLQLFDKRHDILQVASLDENEENLVADTCV